MPTAISEDDLLAYVDDQLDVARRIEVEAYLQEHPALAARVMQDMRQRDEIRLFLEGDAVEQPSNRQPAATKVRSTSPPVRPRLRAAVAAAVFVGLGWTAHALFGTVLVDPAAAAHAVPVFANEAAKAHRTAMIAGPTLGSRAPEEAPQLARLASRPVGGGLTVPTFPKDLLPVASRIVPWDGGAAVQVVYTTRDFERVTLFAAEDQRFAVSYPEVAKVDGLAVVHWRQGHHVYALSGTAPLADLLSFAEATQSSWF